MFIGLPSVFFHPYYNTERPVSQYETRKFSIVKFSDLVLTKRNFYDTIKDGGAAIIFIAAPLIFRLFLFGYALFAKSDKFVDFHLAYIAFGAVAYCHFARNRFLLAYDEHIRYTL